MAIDDDNEEEESNEKDLTEDADVEKMDIDEEDMLPDGEDHEANKDVENKKSGFIGERKEEQDFESGFADERFLEDQENEDELEALIENIDDSAHDENAIAEPRKITRGIP